MKFIQFVLVSVRSIIYLSFVSKLIVPFVRLRSMLSDRQVQQADKNDQYRFAGGFCTPGQAQVRGEDQDISYLLLRNPVCQDKAFRDKCAKAMQPSCCREIQRQLDLKHPPTLGLLGENLSVSTSKFGTKEACVAGFLSCSGTIGLL